MTRFLITPALRASWAALQASNHQFWQVLIQAANATGTAAQWYNDYGNWCAMAYQATGNTSYAPKAAAIILDYLSRDPGAGQLIDVKYSNSNANFLREYGAATVIWLDWIWDTLTPYQQTAAIAGLIKRCNWAIALNLPNYVGGFRMADSDQTIGQYYMLALTDLFLADKQPTAFLQDYNHAAWSAPIDRNVPVGGLDSAGDDYLSIRDRIRQLVVDYATGGEGYVSSEYNFSSDLGLLMLGSQAVQTATGQDHFPEITALLPQLAAQAPYDLTPDLKQRVQWGDDEHPRDPQWVQMVPHLASLAGLVPNDPWCGPTVESLVKSLHQYEWKLFAYKPLYFPYQVT